MNDAVQKLMTAVLAAFMEKDKEAVLALFADDGALIDPHYPQPVMQGKAAIGAGLDSAFAQLAQPGFVVRHTWLDGESGVMEVDTHHVLYMNDIHLDFPQVFVVETTGGQFITRMQSYCPYPPPAMPQP